MNPGRTGTESTRPTGSTGDVDHSVADVPPPIAGGQSATDGDRSAWAIGFAVLRVLAVLYPRTVDPSDDLVRAIDFLEWPVSPATVVRAGWGGGLIAGPLALVLALAFPLPLLAVPAVAASGALGTVHAIHALPPTVAALVRTRALGEAPGIVGRAVLGMRIEPTAESAATFAAETGTGPLATSLHDHVRRAATTPGSGLASFGETWGEWFPALRRSTSLVVAAADAPPGDRERTLDRAVEAVLSGTDERLAAFAADVQGPATALYAFGVLLPLALVALLPAASVAGIGVTLVSVVAVYDVLLPAIVALAGGWLLVRRPVAFPPARIPRSHPARRSSAWPTVLAGIAAGILAGGAGYLALPRWTIPILAVGVGTGTALLVATRSVVTVRREVRAVEEHLPDALYLIGRRVSEGTAVEVALTEVAREVPGETGDLLASAAGVQDRLRVGVEDAFLGQHGALADLPSPRLESAATLLGAAAREGRPAGRAVVATGDHLSDLAAIEREARRDLTSVTDTLWHTAAAFGPLVAGATVRLSEGMVAAGIGDAVSIGGSEASQVTPETAATAVIDPASLGLAVGAYVLVLAVLLTALSVGLEKGLDRALVGYRTGQALIAASAVFVGSYLAAGLLF